jgi:hypothetical protein
MDDLQEPGLDFDELLKEEEAPKTPDKKQVDYDDFGLDLTKIKDKEPEKDVPTKPGEVFEGMSIPPSLRNWLSGIQPEIPQEISAMMDTFVEKINWTVAFLIVQNVGRISHIIDYLKKAEQKLMDVETVDQAGGFDGEFPLKTLRKNYKEAHAGLMSFLEFVRKFTGQHQESLAAGMSEADELARLFRELPPPVIADLKKVLDKHGKSLKKIKKPKKTEA